jgi:hypothetical protein
MGRLCAAVRMSEKSYRLVMSDDFFGDVFGLWWCWRVLEGVGEW